MIERLLANGAEIFTINTDVPDNMFCSNTGMTLYNDNIITNIRCISYVPNRYCFGEHSTENYIGVFSGENYIHTEQLPWVNGDYKLMGVYAGLEDIRLVVWDGVLYGYGTRVDVIDNGACIELLTFDNDLNVINRVFIENIMGIEKNWMAIPDRPFTFVWWNNPLTIIQIDPLTGKIINKEKNDLFIGQVSGSTPLMEYKDKYITIVHKREDNVYSNAFIVYEKDFSSAKLYNWFKFHEVCVEFVSGMVHKGNHVYLSLTISDIFPLILKIPENIFESLYLGELQEVTCNNTDNYPYIIKYIEERDYKSALKYAMLDNYFYSIDILLWMMLNKKNGMNYNKETLETYIEYIKHSGDCADKYYMLALLSRGINKPYKQYLSKAYTFGLPSLVLSKLFNITLF